MIKRKNLSYHYCIAFLFFLIIFQSCKDNKEKGNINNSSYKIYYDTLGRGIYFDSSPERIISLAPSVTEILFAIGAGNKVVAVTTYCNYPDSAKNLPKAGDFSNPNIEFILSLKPDLIFATPQKINDPLLAKFEKLGLKVFVVHPNSVKGIIKSIDDIGKILSLEHNSNALKDSINVNIDRIKNKVADLTKGKYQKVFFEISDAPLMTVNDSSFIGELISIAGGKNIISGFSEDYPVISPEKVISANPDIILIAHPIKSSDDIAKRPGWKNLSAVKNNRIYFNLNEDLLLRPGPRICEGIELLVDIFY